jgi:hypothetical protein
MISLKGILIISGNEAYSKSLLDLKMAEAS